MPAGQRGVSVSRYPLQSMMRMVLDEFKEAVEEAGNFIAVVKIFLAKA